MDLNKHEIAACRAANKLLGITTEGWDEAEGCDRHYDGGEWSGPAWADNWQNEERRVTEVVAARFELDANYLAVCLMDYDNSQMEFHPAFNYDAAMMDPEANR